MPTQMTPDNSGVRLCSLCTLRVQFDGIRLHVRYSIVDLNAADGDARYVVSDGDDAVRDAETDEQRRNDGATL